MRYILLFALIFLSTVSFSKTDKYRLTLRDNPSTSVVIGWNQVSGDNPLVYYGTTDYGDLWDKYQQQAAPDRSITFAEMENQFVRLSGLTPNTSYFFVIKDSEDISRRLWFKTAPMEADSRMSFIAGGDSRNNPIPRRNANLLVSKLKPHAVLFGGDMTSSGTPEQWQTWLDDWQLTISEDGRMYPVIAARGNHEKTNEMIYHLFDVPMEKVYYAITCGENLVRAYVLNTEISVAGEQTSWLQSDLKESKKATWKIAQYHKPMRPHVSKKKEGNAQYMEWAKLFYKEKVQLVVECDAHTVKTTWPIKPAANNKSEEGFVRDNRRGTVYVGEGCWGAPLRPSDDPKSWTRDHDCFNQFKWIFIDRKQIEVRTIKVDNAEEVASVTNDDPFQIPENLDIWSPENGAVVRIQQ